MLKHKKSPNNFNTKPTQIYLGFDKGNIGNKGGFVKNKFFYYDQEREFREDFFYLSGNWKASKNYIQSGNGTPIIDLIVNGFDVSIVLKSEKAEDLEVSFNGLPLGSIRGSDVSSNSTFKAGNFRVLNLVKSSEFLTGVLEIKMFSTGVMIYAFKFI